jgi:hypothetical protein
MKKIYVLYYKRYRKLRKQAVKDLSDIEYEMWTIFKHETDEIVAHKFSLKRRRQNGKLRRLINEIRNNTIPENDQSLLLHFPDPIEESSQQISEDELKLLNKSLKLMPKPKEPLILEIVAEIETSVKYFPISDKENIRYECSKVIKNGNTYCKNNCK